MFLSRTMPSRNSIKDYVPSSYYHVYNRGVEKRLIFLDEDDYAVFMAYLRRHLDAPESDGIKIRRHAHYDSLEMVAYCLMPNHFHLLLYVGDEPRQLASFMQSVCTAYSMYFNKKYNRVGHLFQGRFKASRIIKDDYLQHISRYIHLNPVDYLEWPWSSLPIYLNKESTNWVHPDRVRSMVTGGYLSFVEEYVDQKRILDLQKIEVFDI